MRVIRFMVIILDGFVWLVMLGILLCIGLFLGLRLVMLLGVFVFDGFRLCG